MSKLTKQPSLPYQKTNGKWTFEIEVDGVTKEAGEFDDEQTTRQESMRAYRIWEANKDGDGTTSVMS